MSNTRLRQNPIPPHDAWSASIQNLRCPFRFILAIFFLFSFACGVDEDEQNPGETAMAHEVDADEHVPDDIAPVHGADEDEHVLKVTATAYNSLPAQTQGDPTLTAWGDRLEPGVKAIAVSRDLIPLGLTHGVEVKIEGLPGTYTVMDKMHRRWTQRIDIYMDNDVNAAKEWGKREVTIRW